GGKDGGGERYVGGGGETAIEPAVEVAEIHIEIFGLQIHIAHQTDFEPGADGPAGVADAAAREARPVGIDVSERQPTREVRQEAVEANAHPPARGGKPLVARLATPQAPHAGG